MTPIITAFESSPDRGRGLARDMRVRWAFEETGQPYDVRLVSFKEMKEHAHMALHPFGQIPTYEESDLSLFETGAIILRIAEGAPGLLPDDDAGRSRAIMWMFCAVSTVEPPIVELEQTGYAERDTWWHPERVPLMKERIRTRLKYLSEALGGKDWLDGTFSAGDVMMVLVLRRAEGMGVLEAFPNLMAYVARAEARPAYRRAFAAQHAVFLEHFPAKWTPDRR